MIQLSAVIITLNEERNIERCLKSVQRVADEIVVVDSFSTDGTEKICNEYGAKFIRHKFEGHIQQKNYAITMAAFPYLLSLDADEALTEELISTILEVKSNWQYDGFYFNRLSNYCGKFIKHGSWYPDRKIRLFKSEKGKWGGTNPHDTIVMDGNAITKHIQGDLLHYTYSSIWEHIRQANYFSDIASREAYSKGKKASLLSIVIRPGWKFLRDYFIKRGFLDGVHGFTIAIISSHENFLKYVKLWFLQNENGK